MKKVLLILFAMVLSGLLSDNVLAKQTVSDTDAQIVQAFCQDLDLFAYVHLPKEKEYSALIVDAWIDNVSSYRQIDPIAKITNASVPVSYLFLIDISTSMPSFKDNIKKFIYDFMESAGDNSSYLIATFGKDFEIKGDFTSNQEDIKKELDAIKYNVGQTSLHSAIIRAIDFYENKDRVNGEIYNVVVISDGIEVDKNGVTKNEVDEKIKSSAVIIHTFGLPTPSNDTNDIKNSEEALKVLGAFARTSFGVHAVLGYDNKTETDLASEITGFVNNLYFTKFKIAGFETKGESYSLKLVFATTSENGEVFNALGNVNIPYFKDSQNPSEISIGQSDLEDAIPQNKVDTEVTNSSNTSLHKLVSVKLFGINMWILGIAFVLIILLSISISLLIKKRKKVLVDNHIIKIFMKIEILSGKCVMKNKEFYMTNELIIGRNKNCGIKFLNQDISNKNSRIYMKENIIYLEDLNSTNGTAINGMRIHAPNRLRSGDVVSIGSVKFLLKF